MPHGHANPESAVRGIDRAWRRCPRTHQGLQGLNAFRSTQAPAMGDPGSAVRLDPPTVRPRGRCASAAGLPKGHSQTRRERRSEGDPRDVSARLRRRRCCSWRRTLVPWLK